ncbi:MAG: (d)CMP kinase [Gracilimonas sp.]|uniref:(d)CMP kinase n=1 Tax=Gracilimonas TaxID=649462 RepID=UPI001AFE02BC|nr:(d)CMP kinase [Gracilimonas sp.]MBO6585883.1 (d)CMP kinase [Gracilimonas sp.]MBO6616880.1 (d)CMP kinase [Gracilimonas sp.]
MIVVIDGPAGSGKSSTAKAVAANLQIQFLDSGALYRVATLLYLDVNKDLPQFFDTLRESDISFHFKNEKFHAYLNGRDVSDQIRSMEVSEHVSEVASNPDVRAHLNDLMREVVKTDIYIADGRDLGTAVFPDAALKFFMVADLDTRAQRRYQEVKAQGKDVTLEEVKQNIAGRDEKDSNRDSDPLKKADDAILVDTSEMTFEEQVAFISEKIERLISTQKNN